MHEHANAEESFTEKELIRKMEQIDKMRSQTRAILSNVPYGQQEAYHLTVNTSDWDIKDLAPAVADLVNSWFQRRI